MKLSNKGDSGLPARLHYRYRCWSIFCQHRIDTVAFQEALEGTGILIRYRAASYFTLQPSHPEWKE
nr:hypothetical protein [uncultured Marinobacter sp.]